MQLDKIEAIVRPRTSWEAIDLGFCMMQRWMWNFYPIWFALTFPVFLIVYLLAFLFTDYPEIWASITVWWLKPLFDRIILHFFSHALFGEQITLKQMIRALPSLIFKVRLLLELTFYRLTPVRSFILPIWQLEGNHGVAARRRFRILQQNTHNTALWLTITCAHFQGLIILLLYALVFLLLPENTDFDSILSTIIEASSVLLLIDLIFNYIALSLIEPFYVTGGFALYLNRRTHLEGWDIELMFRQIRKKINTLQTAVAICLVTTILLSFYAPLAGAVAQAEQSKQYIEEVLQQPEFQTTEQQSHWQYVGDSGGNIKLNLGDSPTRLFSWIGLWARLFEMILWLTIGGVIGWIVYKILQNPVLQQWLNQNKIKTYQPQVKSTLVPESKQQSLSSDDIAQQAWQLWQQDKHRQAVSLLYRGTLLQLQQQYEMTIHDSATENECVRLVSRTQSTDLSAYFSRLTRAWQILAYGKHLPDSDEMQQLCNQWVQHFQ